MSEGIFCFVWRAILLAFWSQLLHPRTTKKNNIFPSVNGFLIHLSLLLVGCVTSATEATAYWADMKQKLSIKILVLAISLSHFTHSPPQKGNKSLLELTSSWLLESLICDLIFFLVAYFSSLRVAYLVAYKLWQLCAIFLLNKSDCFYDWTHSYSSYFEFKNCWLFKWCFVKWPCFSGGSQECEKDTQIIFSSMVL